LKLNQNGLVRVSKSQCLGPCDKGAVVMLYPQSTMLTNVTPDDVDQIVEEIQAAIL
jgi:(2Fe-2S) ferredoxin